MTTCTLLNALRAGTAALPLLFLTGAALGQADVEVGGGEGPVFADLTIGQTVNGELSTDDYTTPDGQHWDVYLVTLTAGENYRFDVAARGYSASVGVFTEDGMFVEDALYEADDNSFTIQVARTGTYSVVVGSNQRPQTGAYTLTSRTGAAAPTQRIGQEGPADNAGDGQVRDINVPQDAQRVNATLDRNDIVTDEGKFAAFLTMDLQKGQTFHFLIESDGFPVMLNMQDNDGNFVQINGVGLDGRYINMTAPADGSYTLLIVGLEPNRGGNYTVRAWQADPAFAPASNTPARDDVSDDDDAGYEGTQTIQDQLDRQDTLLDDGKLFDYHAVELTAGVTYDIDVTSAAFDVVGYLFAADNTQLDVNDDAPQMGTNARITFTPQTTGSYSVGISSAKPGQSGRYQVTVTPRDAATPRQAHNTPADDVVADNTQPPAIHLHTTAEATGEQPYYSGDVQLKAGQVIVVETFNLGEGCDTVIQLRRSTDPERASQDDPIVAENDDNEGLFQSRLVYTVPEDGSYYVAVGVYDNRGGEFTLLIRDAYPAKETLTAQVEIEKDGQALLGDFEFDAGQNWIVIDTLDLSPGMDTVIELRKTVDPDVAADTDPVIATNDDFFNNDLSSRLYFDCQEPGLYYLRITNIGKNAGTCTVQIRFEE